MSNIQNFYKIVNKNMCNNGFQYKIGLNELTETFNPDNCTGPGLYFSDIDNIFRWIGLYENGLICEVTIPSYAQISKNMTDHTYKTNYMIINNPLPISIFIEQNKLEFEAVKQNAYAIEYINNPTLETCMETIKKNGHALKYISHQTLEMCMEAVKRYRYALLYVKNKTPEICKEAVRNDGHALKYVNNQTSEICIEAVRQNGLCLRYVKQQTPEICMEAVKQKGCALQYVKVQTFELCIKAVKQNRYAFTYVKDPKALHMSITDILEY